MDTTNDQNLFPYLLYEWKVTPDGSIQDTYLGERSKRPFEELKESDRYLVFSQYKSFGMVYWLPESKDTYPIILQALSDYAFNFAEGKLNIKRINYLLKFGSHYSNLLSKSISVSLNKHFGNNLL